MESLICDDSSECDSNITSDGSDCTQYEHKIKEDKIKKDINVVHKLINRQLYGRFTKNSRSKTEKIYNGIPERCNRLLSDVLPQYDSEAAMQHVYMGFTLCGQYLLSYTWIEEETADNHPNQLFYVVYHLYVWRYSPGQRLKMVSKQTIFRHCRTQEQILDVSFSQWPTDHSKVVAYGVNLAYPGEAYITIIFLPPLKSCIDCNNAKNDDETERLEQLPCLKHLVTIDFMLNITPPYPVYNPIMHLAYPDHIVINTGHYLHILNVLYVIPQELNHVIGSPLSPLETIVNINNVNKNCFSDTMSEISETISELDFPTTKNLNKKTNIVDAILQDFSEYDLEGSECSKPFHELNISCEPLNVTGKSYYNHIDSRYKVLQNKDSYLSFVSVSNGHSSKDEKSKIDKKTAEKAYEFTEENEKFEKISLFRKKRLADKKYEFSEDNSENIIPFNLLRQERKYLYRNRCIKSPDCFLSPRNRSPRSPMLSPNNRGQFSPSYTRSSCPGPSNTSRYSSISPFRVSPICRSPISPISRDQMRRFNVYSPSHIDSDCSDDTSRLILRPNMFIRNNNSNGNGSDFFYNYNYNGGLLTAVVDSTKKTDDLKPRWIRKVIKKFCYLDFETVSLVSDSQSRDEYLCVELPVLVHAGRNEQSIEPAGITGADMRPHLQVSQSTMDLEQFCQRRAEALCNENRLIFSHCQDYDVKIQHICPLSGDIVCTAEIKLGAAREHVKDIQPRPYMTACMFVWNIVSDSYRILNTSIGLQPFVRGEQGPNVSCDVLQIPHINCRKVRDMTHKTGKSVHYLRDSDNFIQISLDKNEFYPNDMDSFLEDSINYSQFEQFERVEQFFELHPYDIFNV